MYLLVKDSSRLIVSKGNISIAYYTLKLLSSAKIVFHNVLPLVYSSDQN